MREKLLFWSNRLFLVALICVLLQIPANWCGQSGQSVARVLSTLWFVLGIPGALLWVYARFVLKGNDNQV